jgi:hypothetical protein
MHRGKNLTGKGIRMAIDEKSKGKLVHTRKIEIRTYDLGNDLVRIEGKLTDIKNPSDADGGMREGSALIHDLLARIWVQGPELVISRVEADMPHIPREVCSEVLPGVQKLVGLKIISGFTAKVKALIGGIRGCAHLTNLFLSLGPVAVQGYWAAYGDRKESRTLDNPVISRVINSCHVWRKDGPLLRSLASSLERKKN